mgnify:CR=1 FL=1
MTEVVVLDGIPVATAELKTEFTQDVQAAVDQYLQSLPTDRDRALAEFAAPMAAPYSEVFGCRTDRDPEFEPDL